MNVHELVESMQAMLQMMQKRFLNQVKVAENEILKDLVSLKKEEIANHYPQIIKDRLKILENDIFYFIEGVKLGYTTTTPQLKKDKEK